MTSQHSVFPCCCGQWLGNRDKLCRNDLRTKEELRAGVLVGSNGRKSRDCVSLQRQDRLHTIIISIIIIIYCYSSRAYSTFPDDLMVLYIKHGRRDEDVFHFFQQLRTKARDGDLLRRQKRVEARVQGVGVSQAGKRHRHCGHHRGRGEGQL